MLLSPNIDWHDEPLRAQFEARIGRPVTLENDANAAGWGEYRFGAGQGSTDMVMVTLGTGVGGAVIGALLSFVSAYLVAKPTGWVRARQWLHAVATLPMAVPGLALGLGYILFFNPGSNPLHFLYGSMGILVLCSVAHFFSVAHITQLTALQQLDAEYERVADSMGVPFWTLLFAWVFLGERVRGWQWLGVGLALAGLVLILEPWNLTSGSISNWLALAGGICWAASAILIKRMRRQGPVDPLGLTFWQMVWGTLPLTALWWMIPGPPVVWGWPLLLVLLFAGCLAGGLGWLVWTLLLSRLSAGTASLNILAIPGVAVLAAWLQLGEVPDMFESIGMLLIALALAVLAFLTIKGERRLKGLAQARPEKCK